MFLIGKSFEEIEKITFNLGSYNKLLQARNYYEKFIDA